MVLVINKYYRPTMVLLFTNIPSPNNHLIIPKYTILTWSTWDGHRPTMLASKHGAPPAPGVLALPTLHGAVARLLRSMRQSCRWTRAFGKRLGFKIGLNYKNYTSNMCQNYG